MIEEAAGTSLYEKKREQTTQIIEKKDTKLKEMDCVSIECGRLAFLKQHFSFSFASFCSY